MTTSEAGIEQFYISKSSRQEDDTVSVVSSMHETAIEQVLSNERINQDCLRKFMGVRSSRQHASVRHSYSDGSSSARRSSFTSALRPNISPRESDEIRQVLERELSLIHGHQVKDCTLSKLSSSLACVSCVVGGIPSVRSRTFSAEDVDESSLKVPTKNDCKRVAFLLDIVDNSEEMDQKLVAYDKQDTDLGIISEGRLSPQSQRIQESIKRIRERITRHHQIDLDDYSQDGQLSFKNAESGFNKGTSRKLASTSSDQLGMLACLGFSSLVDDDIWSTDSYHPVPEVVSTLTFDDDSFTLFGSGR